MRAAKEGNGKGIIGGRGIGDPGWVNEEEGKRGGFQQNTGVWKEKREGKGKGGKGIEKRRLYEEQTEARGGRGMGRRIQH